MIAADMRLRAVDFLDCVASATRTLAAIDDAPAFATGEGHLLGGRRWMVCGAAISLDYDWAAPRIEDVKGAGNKDCIELRGVAARVPWASDGSFGDHPQKEVFVGNARARWRSLSVIAGAYAHEGSHALQNRSAMFDEHIWAEARRASAAATDRLSRDDYKTYLLNPYELAAHASQATVELLVNPGREIFANPDLMERHFRGLWVIRKVASWPHDPAERPATGQPVDLLLQEVWRVIDHADLR